MSVDAPAERESHHAEPIRAGRPPASPVPMSRRGRHGRHPHPHAPRHARPSAAAPHPAGPRPEPRAERPSAPATRETAVRGDPLVAPRGTPPAPDAVPEPSRLQVQPAPEPAASAPAPEPAASAPAPEPAASAPAPIRREARDGVELAGPPEMPPTPLPAGERRVACTGAQLRRFIKSRPWVPMHELRRRFGINGADDDVTPIRVGDVRLFVGLPPAEGRVLAELLGGGDVGYELSMDPVTPVVIGVYPMRPVPRA